MLFDITDLQLFIHAAQELNLTRAAAKQHLSLAAASARLKALETDAGSSLFQRQARGLSLTPAGAAFLHHARLILRQSALLKTELQEYAQGLRGHLRVFANTTAVTDFLPELLPEFLSAHPHINMDLQEKPNAQIAQGVLDGQADLGIVAGPVQMLGLHAVHFSTDELVLITSRQHPWAQRARMDFAETLDEPAVGMHPGSTLHTFLEQITAQLGKPQKLRIQLSSFDAMCRMVGAGVGVGIVPISVAQRHQKSMQLRLIDLNDAWRVRERYVLYRDPHSLSPYAQALIDTLTAKYR